MREPHSARPDVNDRMGRVCGGLLGVEEGDAPSDNEAVHAAVVDEDALKREEIVLPEGEEEGDYQSATSDEDVEKPRVMRKPKQPTRAEIEEHEATHMPPRDWCPDCVRGRGISNQHRKHRPHIQDAAVRGEATIPTTSIDYTFIGTRNIRDGRNPHLAVFDNDRGGLKSLRTNKKRLDSIGNRCRHGLLVHTWLPSM